MELSGLTEHGRRVQVLRKRFFLLVNTGVIIAALLFGWQIRNEYIINAEHGLGYALGITGGVCMLLLLLYPLRKSFTRTRLLLFSTRSWFRIHMSLGLIGPVLILYHSNFGLGSLNSNVALVSMFFMVASGLVGRFIYRKIHAGLYGKKLELQDIVKSRLIARNKLLRNKRKGVKIEEDVLAELQAFEVRVTASRNVILNFFNILVMGISTRHTYRGLIRRVKSDQENNAYFITLDNKKQKRLLRRVNIDIARYLAQIRRLAELAFFERLFSLWHVLHMPIFLC